VREREREREKERKRKRKRKKRIQKLRRDCTHPTGELS
jgi:hypothetical protein